MGAVARLKHAWNAFLDQDETARTRPWDWGAAYGTRPDRVRLRVSNERSMVSAIYTKIAVDVASVDIRHVRMDSEGRYKEDVDSGLNNCLTVEANIDQASQYFMIDLVLSLLDEGDIAVVPIDFTVKPVGDSMVDVQTMRVGKIVQWYPRKILVEVYNDQTGMREQIQVDKKMAAIIENPFYSVMNEPNSTLQRLIRKLNLLDVVDEQSSSGKLDMIIQLPYTIKSETLRQRAEQRRKDIEFQLKGSKYGIAYSDGTEKITQLNRPAENNLLKQVEYLTQQLYSQLGTTPEVMLGTADEAAMLNYINRTVVPILTAITQEFKRKFLTKTGRTQGQSVEFFRDPFKLVPMKDLAEMADKFTRNEIFTSNEFRQFLGIKPSSDPKADELRNSNMPAHLDQPSPTPTPVEEDEVVPSAGRPSRIQPRNGIERPLTLN